jgi:hypothetical protein
MDEPCRNRHRIKINSPEAIPAGKDGDELAVATLSRCLGNWNISGASILAKGGPQRADRGAASSSQAHWLTE